jgi:uncharacterized membrane protein YedE/YeeE
MKHAMRIVTALVAGLIFGFGLSLSGMLDPVRVRGFLDVAGNWDPSLAFVLGGAVTVSALGFMYSRRTTAPAFAVEYQLPKHQSIDGKLIAGAAIFGAGWGIGGLCPGPAIASLALGLVPTIVFTLAMMAGMLMHDRLWVRAPVAIANDI